MAVQPRLLCNDGESVVSGGGRIERSDVAIAFGLRVPRGHIQQLKMVNMLGNVTPTGQDWLICR